MGFVKGGLLVIVSVLFFVFLLLANSFFTISSSLEYENLQEHLVPVVVDYLEKEIGISNAIESRMPEINAYCLNNSEYVFSHAGETFAISCDSVAIGTEAIIDEAVTESVDKIYYSDYSCDFLECFDKENGALFLVSAKTKDYFQGKFYLSVFVLFILLISMFFLFESKTNFPFIPGILIILSSLPFLKLETVISLFAEKSYLQFFSFLFTQSYFVFLVSFILGLMFLVLGLFLKLFVVGFKVSDFFSKFHSSSEGKISKKDIKQVVKEEIALSKSKSK